MRINDMNICSIYFRSVWPGAVALWSFYGLWNYIIDIAVMADDDDWGASADLQEKTLAEKVRNKRHWSSQKASNYEVVREKWIRPLFKPLLLHNSRMII